MRKADSLPKGMQVWEVHYMSQYYDDDPRMPSNVPVDNHQYVLAKSYDEAITEALPLIKKFIRSYNQKELKEHEKIEARPLPLETLVVARDAENDGRLGFHSTQNFTQVTLSNSNYELAIVVRRKL